MSHKRDTPWQRTRRRWRRRMLRLGRRLGLLPNPTPESLSILVGYAAIARYLGVSRDQARRLVRRRAIPAFVLDGAPCARRDSIRHHVARLEAEHRQGAQP